MTAHTVDRHADARSCKDSDLTQSQTRKQKKVEDGLPHKKVSFQKEKSALKRPRSVSVDSNEEVYIPGNLYRKSVEETSEAELVVPKINKKAKNIKRRRRTSTESEEENSENEQDIPQDTEEGFSSMVAQLARAHSLVQSTGKISHLSILIKENDNYISMSSPGESGVSLVKLEIYPFNDCSRLEKNQYWTKRTFSSLGVIYSEESPVHKIVMKLRRLLTEQVATTKGCKMEKKPPTNWKRS